MHHARRAAEIPALEEATLIIDWTATIIRWVITLLIVFALVWDTTQLIRRAR